MSYNFSNKTPLQVAAHYKLRPCPFCGGPASFKRKYEEAYCEPCAIRVTHHWSNEYYQNEAIAWVINKWNTRAADANQTDAKGGKPPVALRP